MTMLKVYFLNILRKLESKAHLLNQLFHDEFSNYHFFHSTPTPSLLQKFVL